MCERRGGIRWKKKGRCVCVFVWLCVSMTPTQLEIGGPEEGKKRRGRVMCD